MRVPVIPFVPLDPNKFYRLPFKADPRSACYDLYAAHSGKLLLPGARTRVGTNLRVLLPIGWEMQIRSRSSAANTGLRVFQGIGTVDCGYIGEVLVVLEYVPDPMVPLSQVSTASWEQGDRIAQVKFEQVKDVNPRLGNGLDLEEYRERVGDRGGGFGSTGR